MEREACTEDKIISTNSSAGAGGEASKKKDLGSAASWRSVARPSSYRRRGALAAKEVTSHDISHQIYRSSKKSLESWNDKDEPDVF